MRRFFWGAVENRSIVVYTFTYTSLGCGVAGFGDRVMAGGKGDTKISARALAKLVAREGSATDTARVLAKSEAALERDIAGDADWRDVPADWYESARMVRFLPKVAISLRVDADIVDFFKAAGPGYQTRIQAVLRAYVTQVGKVRR